MEYRGIPIEQLAKKAEFLEVAYLLINGSLPSNNQYKTWKSKIMNHTMLHTEIGSMMKSFRYNAHPMGILISTVAALSTFHPEDNPALNGTKIFQDVEKVNKMMYRILGTMPTMAANAYRHRIGRSYNMPDSTMGYVENFLMMLDKMGNERLIPHKKIVEALNLLFILHADHEQNCSTAAVRHLTSSGVDIYSAISGGIAALYGPSHGGANEAVLRMLEEIGSVENIPQFILQVKQKKRRLMGFGHRVYKNYDPRARIIKNVAHEVFAIVGKEPLVEIAIQLEKIALNDEYFKKKKLYPNVDFYTGVIYKALGFPTDMFPILFAIPRTVGWLANWREFLKDPEFKIVRPRQNYVGPRKLDYVSLDQRDLREGHPLLGKKVDLRTTQSAVSKRRSKSIVY